MLIAFRVPGMGNEIYRTSKYRAIKAVDTAASKLGVKVTRIAARKMQPDPKDFRPILCTLDPRTHFAYKMACILNGKLTSVVTKKLIKDYIRQSRRKQGRGVQ